MEVHVRKRLAWFAMLAVLIALSSALIFCGSTRSSVQVPAQPPPLGSAPGPLRVSAVNPRYFTNATGKAIYLTGSHTWNNIQDISTANSLPGGNFAGYLDWLESMNHNFIRFWMVEHAWDADDKSTYGPLPWARTGPGTALDGKPKFDLSQFDQTYFDRIRQRAIAAAGRGMYVSVMLFDEWSTEHIGTWKGHPFNANNNVKGINGDPNGDGLGIEFHTLQVPAIVALEEAYVRKVVETVNDLDNVIYELANEVDETDVANWQSHFIDFIHNYEAEKPKQHPVGTTGGSDPGSPVTNNWLFGSIADWVAPTGEGDYKAVAGGPPAADGRKVIISDTDHLWGRGGDGDWVWKSFARGLNVAFMDDLTINSRWESARQAMGQTRTFAQRMDLIHMIPRDDLASTGYCLANPGRTYLAYLPTGGSVTLDLSASIKTFTVNAAIFAVEWFNTSTRTTTKGGTVAGGR